MKFSKMQGIGNDYIYVNCFEETVEDPSALAVRLSDRHFGIGSDGLILIRPTPNGDAMMDLYNADGSRAMMCGNGIRCVGKYVYEKGIARRDVLKIDTLSGVKTLYLTVEDGKVNSVKVAMGEPEFMPERIPVAGYDLPVLEQPVEVCGESFKVTCVSMGNPHCVIFVEDVKHFPVERIGSALEHLSLIHILASAGSLFKKLAKADYLKIPRTHKLTQLLRKKGKNCCLLRPVPLKWLSVLRESLFLQRGFQK